MTEPVLVPCLVVLRAEFNTKYPRRDKGADGWKGDRRHQLEVSDHNDDEVGKTPFKDADHVHEVHAIDIDADVHTGDRDALEEDVERIRHRHKTGVDDRLQNIIWRGRIASRSWGWSWKTRDVGHFDHVHFSARYTTAQERDTSPWGVLPLGHDKPTPKPQEEHAMASVWDEALDLTEQTAGRLNLKPGAKKAAGLVLQTAMIGAVDASRKVDQILSRLQPAALIAGLTPEEIAAAVPAEDVARVAELLAARTAAAA